MKTWREGVERAERPAGAEMVVCEPFDPPQIFIPSVRLYVRSGPSVEARRLSLLSASIPVVAYGHYSDPHRGQYWVAVNAMLTEWAARELEGKPFGILVGEAARKEQ